MRLSQIKNKIENHKEEIEKLEKELEKLENPVYEFEIAEEHNALILIFNVNDFEGCKTILHKSGTWSNKHYALSSFFEMIAELTNQKITDEQWLDDGFAGHGIYFDIDSTNTLGPADRYKIDKFAFFEDEDWLKENIWPLWKKVWPKVKEYYVK